MLEVDMCMDKKNSRRTILNLVVKGGLTENMPFQQKLGKGSRLTRNEASWGQ